MGSITFNKQNGRLKRTLPGQDHYVGLLFYSSTLPDGFGVEDRIKQVNDLAAAESLGITPDHGENEVRVIHYHIGELFRINPDAVLWVAIYSVPVGLHTFAEVGLLRVKAGGKLRKIGVWTSKVWAVGDPALLQVQYGDSFSEFSMHELFYSPNFHGTTTANIPAVDVANSPNVHVIAAQDGGASGKALYDKIKTDEDDYSVGVIGAAIGVISLAKVNENMGWVERFNVAMAGGELDVPALSNGDLIGDLSTAITKDNGVLDTKRIIFLKNYPGFTGTYYNDSHGACPADSDYAYAEDNIAMDKAIRGVYLSLLPKVNGPVLLDSSTGQLNAEYVEYLKLEAGKALEQMEKDGELSGYAVDINPDQDVNATGEVEIGITNTKVGVSRRFKINIGY